MQNYILAWIDPRGMPTYKSIIQPTLPSRIHRLGSVYLPHLGGDWFRWFEVWNWDYFGITVTVVYRMQKVLLPETIAHVAL
jgi:hypothetical protein